MTKVQSKAMLVLPNVTVEPPNLEKKKKKKEPPNVTKE